MNKFKDKSIEEDIFCEAISNDTPIVNVENIVKANNTNKFNNNTSNIEIEREKFNK